MLTSTSNALIATSAIFMALACLSVLLRLHTQKKRYKVLVADDYLIIAACFFSVALTVTIIVGVVAGGLGSPFELLDEARATIFGKVLFVEQFWYLIAVAFVKLSVLCFYGRIFALGGFPMVIKFLMGIVIAWLVAFLFATLLQALPLSCNWNPCEPTMDYPVMYVMSSVTDILLDICILCLPVSFIRKLRLRTNQKIGIVLIFGLGIFCTVASIARLVYAVEFVKNNNANDFDSNFNDPAVNFVLWSGIEACASTVCANLPCYSAIVTKTRSLESLIARIRSAIGFLGSSVTSTKRQSDRNTSSTENIVDTTPQVSTLVEAGTPHTPEYEFEMGRIKVQTTVQRDGMTDDIV